MTESLGNIQDMLLKQREVIRAILYIPNILSDYIHYRGKDIIKFDSKIPIPSIPLISYDDPQICCVLDRIEGYDCSDLVIEPLGPRGKVGTPYLIKYGDGSDMIVKLTKIDKLAVKYNTNAPIPIKNIDESDARHCITNISLSDIKYIVSDEFTNETLIAYVINFAAAKYSLPHLFVQHYQGDICSSTDGTIYGLNFMENCDLGALDKVSDNISFSRYIDNYNIDDNGDDIRRRLVQPNVVKQILTQIVVSIHMLQKYIGFISGDLKAGNVFLKSEPIDTTYMGIKLQAPFTCKIADYGKSSCMWIYSDDTALRFYNENTLADLYLKIHPFTPEVTMEDGEYYYTVGNLSVNQIYTRTRHMGIPFYKSFDYYTVLISLLTQPEFYYIFFSTPELIEIFWEPIWSNEGYAVADRIHEYLSQGKGRRISEVIDLLKGFRLKCDAVNRVITALQ